MLLNIYEVLTPPPFQQRRQVPNPECHQSVLPGRLSRLGPLTAGTQASGFSRGRPRTRPVAQGLCVERPRGCTQPGLRGQPPGGQAQAPREVHLAAAPSPPRSAPRPRRSADERGRDPGLSGPRRRPRAVPLPELPPPGPASWRPGPAAFFLFIINI